MYICLQFFVYSNPFLLGYPSFASKALPLGAPSYALPRSTWRSLGSRAFGALSGTGAFGRSQRQGMRTRYGHALPRAHGGASGELHHQCLNQSLDSGRTRSSRTEHIPRALARACARTLVAGKTAVLA